MKARRYLPGNERGAALLAVLAMVVLLAGFANLGLAGSGLRQTVFPDRMRDRPRTRLRFPPPRLHANLPGN